MGATHDHVQAKPFLPLLGKRFATLLKGKTSRPNSIIAVRCSEQALSNLLDELRQAYAPDLLIADSLLRFQRSRYSAKLRKKPFKNILAVYPTEWQSGRGVPEELLGHSKGTVFLLDNSMSACYCADREIGLDEAGMVERERVNGCFC